MNRPVSRYPLPDVDTLPADLRDRIRAVEEKTGFVPNVFLAFAHRPDELRAFLAYHDAVLERDSGLSKAEREMIVVATSGGNDCQYCVVAHGAILRIRSKDSLLADQIAINYRKADITDRQRAMLDFARKVSHDSRSVDSNDSDRLREFGFTDEDIWDIAAITALFDLSNRMANFLALRPNEEFYGMGR